VNAPALFEVGAVSVTGAAPKVRLMAANAPKVGVAALTVSVAVVLPA
jgi:hypothetical protein